jgi:hypothetical protein
MKKEFPCETVAPAVGKVILEVGRKVSGVGVGVGVGGGVGVGVAAGVGVGVVGGIGLNIMPHPEWNRIELTTANPKTIPKTLT